MDNGKEQVLICGGAGYIGSHTAVALIEAGYEVVIVDNLSRSSLDMVEGVRRITGVEVPFERVDCCDKDALAEVFERYPFRSAIHFAAYKSVGESIEKPIEYYHNNVTSLLNLVELMVERGRNNLIFSSSATVYGESDTLPVTEETPRKEATNPYGHTKQICEDLVSDATVAHPQFRGVSLRYFNPIGAHPSALIGEMPIGVPTNLVPYITQTAAGVRECLSIFGNDYPTPDGTCIRDFIDINDLAEAHVAAIDRLIAGRNRSGYEVYNIATGRGTSVLQLVETFERENGVRLNYRVEKRREGDVVAMWADATLAHKELGWKATRTLEETLRAAWAWEKRVRGI